MKKQMKKILFIGLLFTFCVSSTFAQARFGITAGLNTSKLSVNEIGKTTENSDFKAGFQAGVLMDYSITDNISIIPELLFSQRGGKNSDVLRDEFGNVIPSTEFLTLNYLHLPVNAAYKFEVGYNSKLFIFAGPYLGYGISGKSKTDFKMESSRGNMSEDIRFGTKETELKSLDFGFNFGLGYQFEKVFFKLQYNHGLSNLSNDKNLNSKNKNITVSTGYYFW